MRKDFISFCKQIRGYSEETCKAYDIFLRSFENYCEAESLDVRTLQESDVHDYIRHCLSHGTKHVTINWRVTVLRSYYDFHTHFAGWEQNPVAEVKKLRVPKLLPKFIEQSTIEKAMARCSGSSFLPVRSRAIIAMMYMTGIRRAELQKLMLCDVMISERCVRVFGKGRKERICPIPETLVPYLIEWQSTRAKELLYHSEYYFCSIEGTIVTDSAIARTVISFFQGLVPRHYAHPHILRHSFATRLMQNGVPIVDISRLLGHASVETTLRYLSLSTVSQYGQMLNNVF